jgi:ribose 5-phosphate isomerase B
MKDVTDAEITAIVHRVLRQAIGAAEASPSEPRIVAIGADHGGFELKESLKAELAALGFEVIDAGTHGKEAVDYPDFAHAVANLVAVGKAFRGIVVDGAGIGSCIVANKVPGIRAGMAYDYSSALNSREHNDTNVLTLGAGLIGFSQAKLIVKTWLAADFGGGRHAGRVDKIKAIDKLYRTRRGTDDRGHEDGGTTR